MSKSLRYDADKMHKKINNLGQRIESLFSREKLHRYPTPDMPFSSFAIELQKGEDLHDPHYGYSSEIMSFESNYSNENPKCRVSVKILEKISKKVRFETQNILFETDDFDFLERFIKLISENCRK